MSSRNSIQVAIKVRPLLTKEKDATSHWQVTGNTISLEGSQSEPYCFDFVFDQDASNQIIFEKMARHVVHSTVHGFNGTIFAYGQTASGKTYTMMGRENDPGVMVLAAQEIFNEINRTPDCQFLLRGGYIEIYNEKVYDLLSKSSQELKIHEGPNGNAHVNCEETCITSEDQLLQVLQIGNEARTVGETNMNERSSRSHAIFRLIIESRQMNCEDDDKVTQSVLNLVDLAGSERADQTGARGARLKEGAHINKSLLFLSTVIKRLSENEDNKYISYRDSKLTRILQASLGGNAFTSIICTVTPTSVEETLSTLNFAMRAKTIKNRPHVNEIVSDATMMKRLTREIQDLRKQLDEERLKTASQIKVAQIEELLGFKELKFVNSLTAKSRSQKENRRRTWCPETINTSICLPSSEHLKSEATTSRLMPPKMNVHFTPLITVRDTAAEKTLRVSPDMDALDEEFEPAEFVDFDNFPMSPKTPKAFQERPLKLSISPNIKNTSQHVKLLDAELQQLQEFTNLEKELGVEYDVYKNVMLQLEAVSERNKVLSNERIEYLTAKSELSWLQEQFNNSEKRCEDLQNQVTKLTEDKLTSDRKIERYESDLSDLKLKLKQLEIENCNAAGLQFEFETYRKKSKLREKELLEVLDEKDLIIAKLEKQLKALSAEKLHNTKEELMQLTQCAITDSTEKSFSNSQANDAEVDKVPICQKCENLQRLLDDSKKVEEEFDKLTKQYKELQYNYEKVTADAHSAEIRLAEFTKHQSEALKIDECEELRGEITVLRSKLKDIESQYQELKCDRDEKSERCESLCKEVEVAQQQLCELQNKYVILERNWQKQEETIAFIKADYSSLEKKYNELKTTYESLEHSSTKCSTDCALLQDENDVLQNEIQKLKARIEDMQEQLLDGWGSKSEKISNDIESTEASVELQSENERLKVKLKELQDQYDQLQQEYDQLSMNIMETVQENDALVASCKKLEANIKESEKYKLDLDTERTSWESERATLEKKVAELQQRLEVKSLTISSASSGIVTGDDELVNNSYKVEKSSKELMKQVDFIELEYDQGKYRTYTATDTQENTTAIVPYKLSLRHWEDKKYTNGHEYSEEPIEYGMLNALLSFTSKSEFELVKQGEITKQHIQELQETIHNLETLVRSLQDKNEALFESSQRNINDLREQIKILTAELCEKSMVLDDLVKEKAEITLLNEELQLKVAASQSSINITCSSSTSFANQTIRFGSIENMNEFSSEDALKAIKNELMDKEEECNQLKLEMLEKLELSESEFRSNLRKYNEEWEQSRLKYKRRIEKLEQLLTEKGIPILKEEYQLDNDENDYDVDDQKPFEDDVMKMKCEHEDSYTVFEEDNKSSTPTTPPYLGAECSESLRMHRSHIMQKCNSQISKLCEAIEDAKAVNLQLSETLVEKEGILYVKEAQIVSLRLSIDEAELKIKDLSEKVEKNLTSPEHYAKMTGEMEQKMQTLEKQKSEYESEIKLLKANLEERESRVLQLEENAFVLENKLNNIEKNELNEKKEELAKARADLKESGEKFSELQDQLISQRVMINEAEEKLNSLQGEYDNIVRERDSLIAKVHELAEQSKAHVAKLKETDQTRTEVQSRLEVLLKENKELQSKVDELSQDKLQVEADTDLLKTTEKELINSCELNKKLKQQLEQMEKDQAENQRAIEDLSEVKAERNRLQDELTVLKLKHVETENMLEKEKSELLKELEECKITRNEIGEKSEAITLKMEALAQELHESKLHSANLEKLLQEYEGMEKQLEVASQGKAELELEITNMRVEVHELKETIKETEKSKNNEIEKLQLQLKEQERFYTAASSEHEKLLQNMALMKTELCNLQIKVQHENEESQSKLNELQLKCASLEESNAQLKCINKQIEERLLEAQRYDIGISQIREKLQKVQNEKEILQLRIGTAVAQNDKLSLLQGKLEKQEKAYNDLRLLMDSKETAFENIKLTMENTIAKLESENKNLEERLRLMTDVMKNRTDVCESANNSMESSTHSQSSPRTRISPSKILSSVDDKLSIQKERKNRRLSTHDENRRRSAMFSVSVDASTITDPYIKDCECNELKQELKECKTQLFIRQSQVTALNLELRNHPLKAEKVTLVKRIQEEQDKNRMEIKKYEMKIAEQAAKIQALIEKVNVAATIRVPVFVATTDQGTCTSPGKSVRVTETQTDMPIDQSLQKLQGKYNDIKNICRFRYNQIVSLRKTIEEKENICGKCAAADQQHQQMLTTDSPTQKDIKKK